MARVSPVSKRKATALSMALLAWDIWKRIPSRQRRQIRKQAQKHVPRLTRSAYQSLRRVRR